MKLKSQWAYITAIVALGAALAFVGPDGLVTYVANVTDDARSQTDATHPVPVSDPATGPIVDGGGAEVPIVSAAKGAGEGTGGEILTRMATYVITAGNDDGKFGIDAATREVSLEVTVVIAVTAVS